MLQQEGGEELEGPAVEGDKDVFFGDPVARWAAWNAWNNNHGGGCSDGNCGSRKLQPEQAEVNKGE